MIKVSTRVHNERTAAWVEVIRETSAPKTIGVYRLQYGAGGPDSTPDASIPITEYDRGELVKALGGIWTKS